MKNKHLLNKFLANRSGNIAPIFAVLLVPILLTVGATIDYSRGTKANSNIQDSADAAVLASLLAVEQGKSETEAIQAGKDIFTSSLPDNPMYSTFKPEFMFDSNQNANTITVTVDSSIPNLFMGIIGISDFPVNITSMSYVSTPRQEISLIMDVSQSMLGNNRFESMKNAAKEFVTTLEPFENGLGYRIINFVPFANRVNLGSSYSHWVAPTAPASVPFDGCFVIESNHQNLMDNLPSNPPGQMLPYRNTIRDNSHRPFPDKPRCVSSESEVNLFQSDKNSLISYVDNLKLGFGTGTDEALQWGWRTLSPKWRSEFNGPQTYPSQYAPENNKIIVLLTDGQIFRQELKKPYPIIPSTSPAAGSEFKSDNTARNDFNRICKDIEDNTNIMVFTIGYDLGGAAPALRDALQNCASNGGSYYDASTTSITNTFKDIAEELRNIRLTQ